MIRGQRGNLTRMLGLHPYPYYICLRQPMRLSQSQNSIITVTKTCTNVLFPSRFQPVVLLLLDITPMLPVLEGVVMELQDCALPLLRGTHSHTHTCIQNGSVMT